MGKIPLKTQVSIPTIGKETMRESPFPQKTNMFIEGNVVQVFGFTSKLSSEKLVIMEFSEHFFCPLLNESERP